MYYLEDKHPVYEYCIYKHVGTATPYLSPLTYITDFNQLHLEIEEIEKRHQRYRQPFYIDNDFYNNQYSEAGSMYYYKFLFRRVNDWKELRTTEKTSNCRVLKLAK